MASESELAAGLDIGSAQTRCVICLHEGNGIRLLGYGESESHGWVKGRLSDHSAITGSVRLAVREAERKAQTVIEGAVLGIGGGTVEGWNNRGVYEFARPREIDPGDLSYAVELASKLRLHEDRFLLQVVPQDFTVDGRAGFRNPRGAVCSRLEANVHIITTSANEHQSVVNAVHQAHLAVEETVFEPLAAAYASVVQEERARGVAVIDMGAHSTGLVVYDGEALLLAVTLPISSDHFTRDVAYGLTVSYEDAENLKKEYGCAVLGLTSDNSLIEVPSAEGRPPRETPVNHLFVLLEARAEEMMQHVRNEIARAGMEQSLLEGVVLTGGGALLNGMCDMAERVVNCQARNGLPSGIEDWPEVIHDPSWCVAAGLSMYSAKLKKRKEWKRKAPGIVGLVLR